VTTVVPTETVKFFEALNVCAHKKEKMLCDGVEAVKKIFDTG
jgi:hypothetical protein